MTPVRDMSQVTTVILRRHQEVRNALGTGYTVGEVARMFNMHPDEVRALWEEDEE